VRDLLKKGNKNIDIQKLLNLPRHTITRIKNGEIVCRNEEKKEKKSLTQEEVNLSKRKINAHDIIFVIEKFIEKWKPMQILDYFIEQKKNNITIDMIKNIKRNLQNGKSVIYESELSKDKYEFYLNLLKQFTEINV
jgi:nicotinic acid mononucleotide adenylyltransferase